MEYGEAVTPKELFHGVNKHACLFVVECRLATIEKRTPRLNDIVGQVGVECFYYG